MGYDVIRVKVGNESIGMIDLESTFEYVQSLGIDEPAELAKELLQRAKKKNYIAPGSESEYGKALLREYKRTIGIPVEENESGLEIIILGPGCTNCEELKQRVMSVAAELGIAADISHVKDLTEITKYGMIQTPALVLNGKVKCSGTVPTISKLKSILESL